MPKPGRGGLVVGGVTPHYLMRQVTKKKEEVHMFEIRSAREIRLVLMDALSTPLDAAGAPRARAALEVCARIAPVATSQEAQELAELTARVSKRLELHEQLVSARGARAVDAAGVVSELERWMQRAQRALELEASGQPMSPALFVELVVCKSGLTRLEGDAPRKRMLELVEVVSGYMEVDEEQLGQAMWPDVQALCRQLDGACHNAVEAQRRLMAVDELLLYAAQLEQWEHPGVWMGQCVEQVMEVANARRGAWAELAGGHVSAVLHSFAMEHLEEAAFYRLWCGI